MSQDLKFLTNVCPSAEFFYKQLKNEELFGRGADSEARIVYPDSLPTLATPTLKEPAGEVSLHGHSCDDAFEIVQVIDNAAREHRIHIKRTGDFYWQSGTVKKLTDPVPSLLLDLIPPYEK